MLLLPSHASVSSCKKKKSHFYDLHSFHLYLPFLSLSSVRFLAAPFPVIFQSLSMWPVSPATTLRCFNAYVTFDKMATHSSSSPLQHFTPGYPLQCTYTDWVLPSCSSSTFRTSDANALCASLLPLLLSSSHGDHSSASAGLPLPCSASASRGDDLLLS